jgi:hypothetical protein
MEAIIYAVAAGLFVVLLFLPGRQKYVEDAADAIDLDADLD